MDAFLKEHAEALKKIAAKNLGTALRSRHMAQFPMSTFTRLFLEKFEKQLATDQVEVLSMWQAQLCAVSAPEQEAITAKRKKAVLEIQEFFAKFAADIVELQKKDLRIVANSFQANKHAEWMRAKNFFLLHFDFLALEEKDLLQDWQLVLCDVSTLESVALLSGLQRCFERVDAFLKEHAEALKKIAAKNLGTALRSRHMAQFPMSTFTRLFLEKFEKQLATEQVEVLSMWQAQLCAVTAAEQEAVAAKRKKAVLDIQEFFAKFAADIVELQKKDLRSVVMSYQATKHAEWKQAQNFFVRHFEFLSVEDKDLLQDWELILCDMSTLESVALLPRLSRSFDRMKAVVVEHSDKLKLQKRMSLVDSLESSDMQCIPMCCFCALFLKRHLKRLSAGQIAEVAEWERDFCVTETELVGKFLEMLQRREADLKMLNATCVEQLFSGHLKKTDADLRFGYDFVRRSWTQLSLPEQKRVQQALQLFVVQVEQILNVWACIFLTSLSLSQRLSCGFQHTSAGNRCRMMHSFKRLPPVITSTEDKNIGILCSDWPMVALWKIVEIGRYEGVLCVSSDRTHSRPEDQAPGLLQMTEKRCAMAMAYLLWHLIIASVRRTRSLHTVRQVCTFHWLPCVSLLTASAHAKSIK